MKAAIHILKLTLVFGILISMPTTRHFCEDMLSDDAACEMHKGCCSHDTPAEHDCCYDEYHIYTNDIQDLPTFSHVVIAHLSDFWVENIIFGTVPDFDIYTTNKYYLCLSTLPPKDDAGRYKYVQSFLI